jgi:ubiquinone/menaquinone biosynthesis C-methylase UbiE
MNAVDPKTQREVAIQREYYAKSAHEYDARHLNEDGGHSLALQFMLSVIQYFGIRSILDVGSGTGRVLLKIKSEIPYVKLVGIEPSEELRRVGHSKGLLETELIDGDAMNLAFSDGSFDLVCEFGALHHMPAPSKAVSEMLRVSRDLILISDCNSFGQGSWASRLLKQSIDAVGLWPLADLIKTKGKGYSISEGDGLSYSYSVFSDYRQIKEKCRSIHMMNNVDASPNLYRSAEHVSLLGIKGPQQPQLHRRVEAPIQAGKL